MGRTAPREGAVPSPSIRFREGERRETHVRKGSRAVREHLGGARERVVSEQALPAARKEGRMGRRARARLTHLGEVFGPCLALDDELVDQIHV